jgi:maltose O-acetyltransferase
MSLGALREARARVARAVRDEIRFDALRVLGGVFSRLLPQFSFNRARTVFLRATGLRIGTGSRIMGPLIITGPGDERDLFEIGEQSFVSGPLRVDLGASVRIGNGVQLGHDVFLLTINHEVGPPEHRCGRVISAPISIGDGVWIGSRAMILPGVSIGAGAIVAAGAVVSRDIAPNTLVAGVPARHIRDLLLGSELQPVNVSVPAPVPEPARKRQGSG